MDDTDSGDAGLGPDYSGLEKAIRDTAEKSGKPLVEAADSLLLALTNGLLTTRNLQYIEDLGGIEAWVDQKPGFWFRIREQDSQFPPGDGFFLYRPALELWWAKGCPTEPRHAPAPPPEGEPFDFGDEADLPPPNVMTSQANGERQPKRRVSTAAAVKRARDDLIGRMLNETRQFSKSYYLAVCVKRDEHLKPRGARTAWDEAIEETKGRRHPSWSKRGPLKRSR